MGRRPVLKYRKLAAMLRKGGAVFVRQRGSHRMWEYNGVECVIPAHNDGDDVLPVYLGQLRDRWRLTPADGVSDADFLAGRWKR